MDLLRFTTAGSVDDGKSTFIGRLFYDTKAIFQDQMDSLKRAAQLHGEASVNLAYLTDGLKAEREQGITIDVAYRYFATPRRKFIIADTPGHEQYTRNMVTGASTAELAVILVDARNGVATQTRRHGFIASLLGIKHIIIAVNKMDLVDFSQRFFDEIVEDYCAFSEKLEIPDIQFVPISALHGDNIVTTSVNTPWYDGGTVLHHLETVTVSGDRNLIDFRLPVQTVIRSVQDFRGYAGKISSGSIKMGEEIAVLPSGLASRVRRIITGDVEAGDAFAPQSVVVELEDDIDISRGDMIVRTHNRPQIVSEFDAMVCWMDRDRPLRVNVPYTLQHTTRMCQAFIEKVEYVINVNTLHREFNPDLNLNEIGRIHIRATLPLFVDEYRKDRATGSFIIIDNASSNTVAAGMIRDVGRITGSPQLRIERSERGPPSVSAADLTRLAQHIWHAPWAVWFTGLSGAGKSAIADHVLADLSSRGFRTARLDGDNLRNGLCSDLGFSEADRHENLRRAGHVARLLYDAGLIVLCSFISPYRSDRQMIRELFPSGSFLEIFVRCDIEQCVLRDPKGLYRKAIGGEISDFTGISAPYEEPVTPELVVDTTNEEIESSVRKVIRFLEQRIV
jgi:bifunctional enzyme CysN/CysC